MIRRRAFFAALAGAPLAAAQQLPVLQHASGNAPVCPVCHSPVQAIAVTLATLSPEGALDGSSLIDPTLVCTSCRVHFSVLA